jgi:hypothetical protein
MVTTVTQMAWERALKNGRREVYVSVAEGHIHLIAGSELTEAVLDAFAASSGWDGSLHDAPPEPLPGQQTFFDELLEEPLASHG